MVHEQDDVPARLRSARVRVPKAAELVAGTLRRSIVRGELSDGDGLPSESVLIAQFGISRPTLREAFRILESERLLSVRRGSHGGARVHAPTSQSVARYAGLVLEHQGTRLADVFAATAEIEGPCAAKAAASRTDDDLATLRAAIEAEDQSLEDPAEVLALQTQFHRLVVTLSDSGTLSLMSDMLRSIIDIATERLAGRADRDSDHGHHSRKGSRAHRRLVELIAEGDAAGAERLWRKHIHETQEYLLTDATATTVVDILEPTQF